MAQADLAADAGPAAERTVSDLNSEFWNELCGTHLANMLGITDASVGSLKKFDDWYLDFYPYLLEHIPFDQMKGKRVLEVGVGYGTVAQRMAQTGADFTALDIAAGPVEMVRHRLHINGLAGDAKQGSILAAPFADNTFDHVVTIGCLHHTGDMQRAIDEVYRILKPGGRCSFMVYYAYSYLRFWEHPAQTVRAMAVDLLRLGAIPPSSDDERHLFDYNVGGQAAPHTDFLSRRQLRRLCRKFREFRATLENVQQEGPFSRRPREHWFETMWPKLVGRDVYCSAVK